VRAARARRTRRGRSGARTRGLHRKDSVLLRSRGELDVAPSGPRRRKRHRIPRDSRRHVRPRATVSRTWLDPTRPHFEARRRCGSPAPRPVPRPVRLGRGRDRRARLPPLTSRLGRDGRLAFGRSTLPLQAGEPENDWPFNRPVGR
jgi:hypothetical protein